MNGCVQSMARRLEEAGFTLQSVFAMGSSIDAIDEAGAAEANLVVSSVGLPAAKIPQAQFGTPYVIGAPFGDFSRPMYLTRCGKASARERLRSARHVCPDAPDTVIVGESVTAKSRGGAGRGVRDRGTGHLPRGSARWRARCVRSAMEDEEEIEEALRGAKRVIADPLYWRIVPAKSEFLPLPHEAFSGRIYRKQIPNLAERV